MLEILDAVLVEVVWCKAPQSPPVSLVVPVQAALASSLVASVLSAGRRSEDTLAALESA